MSNRFYNHQQTLIPGTLARAEAVEAKSSSIASGFDTVQAELDAIDLDQVAEDAATASAAAGASSASAANSLASASAAQAAESNVNDLVLDFPYRGTLNLDTLGGRFGKPAAGESVLDLYVDPVGSFDQGLFDDYNGGTIVGSVKFIHDNVTNGGAGLPISSSMQALLAALGRTGTNARYGTEFYLLQTKFGTGTANPHPEVSPDCYLHTVGSTQLTACGFHGYVTAGAWIRRINDVSEPCVWGSTGGTIQAASVDGVQKSISADGVENVYFNLTDTLWHRCVVLHQLQYGYLSVPWPIYGNDRNVSNGGIEIALPFIIPGKLDLTNLDWVSPLPGLNEVTV